MIASSIKKHIAYLLKNHPLPRIAPRFKGLDNIHYTTTKIDGPQKPFRFAVSEREAGKSTTWLRFYRHNYITNETMLVLRRQIADVTDTYISDICNIINKFSYVPVDFIYKKGDIKSGILDIYVAEWKMVEYIDKKTQETKTKKVYYNKRLFFRILGMSNPMSRIKSLIVPNIRYIFFDEFICNLRLGEKYLPNEAFKFKEIYNTFYREAKRGIICYFFGNPYSVYNPYWEWLKVDTKLIKPGAYINKDNYTIECYQLLPELRDQILKKNPLYQFDDSYKQYAFNGLAVNDMNIRLGKRTSNCKLRFVFKIDNNYLGYFRAPANLDNVSFYCESIKWNNDYRRLAYCFDFNDLDSNSRILQSHQKELFLPLKYAIANNYIVYNSVSEEYLTESLYPHL